MEEAIGWMKAPPSREAYRDTLAAMLGFYEPLERLLEAQPGFEARGFDLLDRAKRGWLEQDLRALGLDEGAIADLPRCADLPPVDGFGAALGVAYVLEGATLGGRMITSKLAGPLALTPETGMRFYASYGREVGPRWVAFLDFLEREGDGAAAEAASQTFACLQTWLTDRGLAS